jgi:hypothetical protein
MILGLILTLLCIISFCMGLYGISKLIFEEEWNNKNILITLYGTAGLLFYTIIMKLFY